LTQVDPLSATLLKVNASHIFQIKHKLSKCLTNFIDRSNNVGKLNLKISFDLLKSENNQTIRGLSFNEALKFEWLSAILVQDSRHDYGEARYSAVGYIESRLHVLVFTPREQIVHIISLRKANPREVAAYDQKTKS
jgi:uncharacterized DUF497 family protein